MTLNLSPRTLFLPLLVACGGATTGEMEEEVVKDSPVLASISAATLGDECANSSMSAGAAKPSGDAERCAPGANCESFSCRASNVQIDFSLKAQAAVKVSIVKVVLVDEKSGASLDTLSVSQPTLWNGSNYVAWDEKVQRGPSNKVSYRMSSPKWSAIGSNGLRYDGTQQKYYINLTVKTDYSEFTIRSGTLSREPEIAT